MIMCRILKTFGDNGVKEFGVLQAVYRVHSFFGKADGIMHIIPSFIIIEAISTFVLLPLAVLFILPVIGSACMHNIHKKFINLLSTVDIKKSPLR